MPGQICPVPPGEAKLDLEPGGLFPEMADTQPPRGTTPSQALCSPALGSQGLGASVAALSWGSVLSSPQ